MRVEYINPFITALCDTFGTMLSCPLERGAIELFDGNTEPFAVSGVIGLSGNAVGTVVVSLTEESALRSASALLMSEETKLNADVIDAVGEIANMVAGAAKAKLEEFQLSISLPNVITGVGHVVNFMSDVNPISVPFTSPFGKIRLVVGLTAVREPAHV